MPYADEALESFMNNDSVPESVKSRMKDDFEFMNALSNARYNEYIKLCLELEMEKVKGLNQLKSGKYPMSVKFAEEMIDKNFEKTENGLKKMYELIISNEPLQIAFKKLNSSLDIHTYIEQCLRM